MNQQLIEQIVGEILGQLGQSPVQLPERAVPIAVSARHVHLQPEHVEVLFGAGYELTQRSELSQPGQFAANETVMIAGPKSSIERVRILGPVRKATQVEVSFTDAMKLGVKPPLRESGNIEGSAPITLIGPKGSVHIDQGLIIAQAHIHMAPTDATRFGVVDGEYVTVEADGVRSISFRNVRIRVNERYRLEMHIDTDEANAGFITQGSIGRLVKPNDAKETVPMQATTETTKSPDPVVRIPETLEFTKKLLSAEDVADISEKEIVVNKGTIVTALARDTARELGKMITSRK
ncbi:phosphate propanoyltransferase [Sporosarcina sp. P12(2017)]|uniref:Phosphate propanoyltransferase n=2 Tax=Sporosarcina ureae TaxID=1571 RepID=A0ABN4YRB8_SPOUR|nr:MULTISPECIES: phosphate propanoyltransferase [Sporosarcina]ARF14382.1 acetate kinase [Sporosarcina ureae]PIC57307.1 phosphate propanoyltransferase [Sporosarcina sp. P10]PIC60689.1 phosphate propanoyltransferase [Sporosarcina sp. P12(2017)]